MALPIRPGDLTDAVDAAGRLRRWIGERFGRDHRAILGVRTRADQQLVGGYYAVVAAAPARRIAPRDTRVLVEVARKMAAAVPSLGAENPASAGIDTIRFERRDEEGYLAVAFEVRTNGLLELVWRVAPAPADEAGPTLSIRGILQPLRIIAGFTGTTDYSRLAPRRSRVDWYFGLTPRAVTPTGSISWAGLAFPGREPGGRATEARPVCPAPGFAARSLRSSRRRKALVRLMDPIIRDILIESGYLDVDGAVEDASRACTSDTA